MGKAEAAKAKLGISYIRDYKMRSISTMSGSQYIDEVSIENFYSIKKIEKLKLGGAKEVYFLGENGDGKSLLLMAIHLAFNGNYIKSDAVDSGPAGEVKDMLKKSGIALSGKDTDGNKFGRDEERHLPNLLAYGANRGLFASNKFDSTGFMSLYKNNVELVSPVLMLHMALFAEEEPLGTQKSRLGFNLGELNSLFESLLDDQVQIKLSKEISLDPLRTFVFVEKGFKSFFDQLSEGYKNIMIWVSDMVLNLRTPLSDPKPFADYEGIVLVDEIDLHLHPQWQGSLVKKLRTAFPKIQFIFTTHSPAMLQGAGDDAVFFRVYREGEAGETKVSEPFFKKNMKHMMFNTLMTSPLFGLESARISPDTELPDTDDDYLGSRIAVKVRKKLAEQKKAGKKFISPEDIDALIEEVMNGEIKA